MAVVRPICTAYASRPEVIIEMGRVSSTGAVVAPAQGASFTVTKGATGVYVLNFINPYAEFLSAQVNFEGTGVGAVLPEPLVSWDATAKALTVTIVNSTPAGQDFAFNFQATFADSVVP